MKLEIKHISPYLPYGLRIKNCYFKRHNEYKLSIPSLEGTVRDFQLKPILRPLKDLTKEIEVNGEKFVPIEKFCEIEDCRTEINIRDTKFNIEEIAKNGVQYDSDFGVVSYLFEWHFDVFGLIKNDFAVDINTIKK